MNKPIPSGVSMMLKSFGFDPDATVQMINSVILGLREMNARLSTIEAQNERILAALGEGTASIPAPETTETDQ